MQLEFIKFEDCMDRSIKPYQYYILLYIKRIIEGLLPNAKLSLISYRNNIAPVIFQSSITLNFYYLLNTESCWINDLSLYLQY